MKTLTPLVRLLPCLLASTALGACGGTNVLLNPAIERVATRTPVRCEDSTVVDYGGANVVRAYFDRDGDLYPGLAVGARLNDSLFAHPHQPLRASFEARKDRPGPWAEVADSLGVEPRDPGAWADLQSAIRSRVVARIRQATSLLGRDPRTLVVLVHGFNVADAECAYQVVRSAIDSVAPDVAYLQVNWDGLVTESPVPVIWSRAQSNFALVGMGIRRVLNELDPNTPVRILTHSSGGPVAAHALWDASGAEGPTQNPGPVYRELLEMREAGTLPHPPVFADLRLGMIVPAAPASLFNYYNLGASGPDRILIGMNPRDIAVNKTILAPCSLNGNTCLPVRASYACSVRRRFRNDPSTSLLLFNFSRSTRGNQRKFLVHEAHDWTVYMRRDDIAPFLQALLGEAAVKDEGGEICD